MLADSDVIVVGRVTGVHGVRGWVRIYSWTDPRENIFDYQPWYLRGEDGWEPVALSAGRPQGKSLVAHLAGETDRDRARERFVGRDIAIPREALPAPAEGEYYWRDLIGLRVRTRDGTDLGRVASLLETGANDVLVVRGDDASLDQRERLLPWAPGEYVLDVDLAAGLMLVDWDPEF